MDTEKHELMSQGSQWLATKNDVMRQTLAFQTIENDSAFLQAGTLIETLGKLRKELETERKRLTAPLDAAKKEIMNREKLLANDLELQRERLRGLCGEYATKKQKEREEQQLARQQAQADAAMAADIFGGSAEDTALPMVDDKLASGAIKQVIVYTFEIVDEAKLDRKFLSADETKIRAFCQYLKSMKVDPSTVQEPGLIIKKEVRIDGK